VIERERETMSHSRLVMARVLRSIAGHRRYILYQAIDVEYLSNPLL
jgi:hypothetical protein